MSFIVDKQTLSDLNIFEKSGGRSIYSLFNRTKTRGGALVLEEMFRFPLSDADKINNRSDIIRYFMVKAIPFPFFNEDLDTIEHYLSNQDSRSKLENNDNSLKRKIKGYIGADTEYEQIHKGVISTIQIINQTFNFLDSVEKGSQNPYNTEAMELRSVLENSTLTGLRKEIGVKKLSYEQTAAYDQLLRYESNELLNKVLYYLFNIDVYISVAMVAKENNFCFAKALPKGILHMEMEDVYYPLLKGAKPNSITMDASKNIIFLTGANMAGKSTFMKSFGAAIFLMHMGFPIAAKRMEYTVQNGMYTTINLPDNLAIGYSHFYAEVLRLKKVAEQVSRTENLVVIFDELFRGTNVKDAHEATVEVSKAFSNRRNCTFMISTHIIEAGDDLQKCCDNINYLYLPTIMKGSEATYPYTLAEGVTNDRHGMMIINNEQIIDVLKKSAKKQCL